MSANYWAWCRGANGTRATYKNYRYEGDARIGGRIRWEREHPNEKLVEFQIDGVEDSYENSRQEVYSI